MIRLALALLGAASLLSLSAAVHAQSTPAAPTSAPVATPLPHISIVTIGSGSPVVLIPGLSSPRAVWDGVAGRLARHHRVILVQVNGFGGDAPGENLKDGLLAGVVADLHFYFARHKLSGVPVVGHSMGGLVAMMWAKAHPVDVGKAMIVDALPFVGLLFGPDATVAAVTPRGRVIRDQMAASYGKPADPAAAEAVATGLTATPDARAKVTRWVMAADPRVGAQAFYEDLTTDLRPDLPALTTPLTIVYPWAARGPSEAQASALYRGAYAGTPNAHFVAIADSAHFVMLDQPAAFQAAVAAFLKR
ncbi:MAG: alpha/beta hydrolase [Pseudomonadota bacterium]